MEKEHLKKLARVREIVVGSSFSAAGDGLLFDLVRNNTHAKELALGLIAVGSTVIYNALNHEPISSKTKISSALKGLGAMALIFTSSYLATRGVSNSDTAIMGASEVVLATGATLFTRKRNSNRRRVTT